MEIRGYFSNVNNMDSLCLGFYTLAIVLGALKEDLGEFFQTKDVLNMVYGMCSIRVFLQFLLYPYYEPLP